MVVQRCTWLYSGVHGCTAVYMGVQRRTWVYSGVRTSVYMSVQRCTWVYSSIHECTAVVHGYTAVYASYNTLNAPVAMGYTLRKLCTQSDISLLSFSFSYHSYHTLQGSKIQLFS